MEGQSTLAGAGGSNFGGTSTTEFGQKLWKLSYLTFGGGGAINYRFNDDHNDLAANPC